MYFIDISTAFIECKNRLLLGKKKTDKIVNFTLILNIR